ncbi:MAG TPA: SOS response-associated peptidase [Candidatus Corynebacterium gallistercoris]|uniref:Abasic site processing protein n=1 Tax=Candidatus Corynebacterium gallistercoris TaxID=2838530 RepID=A0A9D1RYQ8_9CORY|nr:SOS response-associated peptidase [Candidatus Corynebacterium gallistercoris]
MCGRYVLFTHPEALTTAIQGWLGSGQVPIVGRNKAGAGTPNYNVAPTHTVPILRDYKDKPILGPSTWGYPPNTVFNARGETAFDKPLFSGSVPCAVPMDGWYEWTKDGTKKQPWFTSSTDGEPLFAAGLCSAREGVLYSTIITTAALPEMEWLHHRMPRILTGEELHHWLAPESEGELRELAGASRPAIPQHLTSRKVTTKVGNVSNNGPELLDEVE